MARSALHLGVPLTIHIWSDIACPWCYVGKRRLEAALEGDVDIVWRSFELDPSAPREVDMSVPYAERLSRKYRVPVAQAEQMIATMTRTAADEGLDFRFDQIRPGNTFDAHRLLHLAKESGLQGALKERLMLGYLCQGARIGDPETLAALAIDVGIEADAVQSVLGTDAFADAVRADEKEATAMGVRGVPFFLMGRFGVSGAQPVETLRSMLRRAVAPEIEAGAMCGPEGCDP